MIRDQETLQLLQDSVRRFVREVLMPNDDVVAELDAIPESIVGQMRELGLFGLAIPEEYGGQRGAHTCDVIFENCRVPAANLIGGVEGAGWSSRAT